jgi:hypothetical protein
MSTNDMGFDVFGFIVVWSVLALLFGAVVLGVTAAVWLFYDIRNRWFGA